MTNKEIQLLNEMKEEYLNNNKDKFNLLCNLENYIVKLEEKSNNRYKAIKGLEKYNSKIQLEAQRYFDILMKLNYESGGKND